MKPIYNILKYRILRNFVSIVSVFVFVSIFSFNFPIKALASVIFNQTPQNEIYNKEILNSAYSFVIFGCSLNLDCGVSGQTVYNVGVWIKKVGNPDGIRLQVANTYNDPNGGGSTTFSNSIPSSSVSDKYYTLQWFHFPAGVMIGNQYESNQFFQFQFAGSLGTYNPTDYYKVLQKTANDYSAPPQWCVTSGGCYSSSFYWRMDNSPIDLSEVTPEPPISFTGNIFSQTDSSGVYSTTDNFLGVVQNIGKGHSGTVTKVKIKAGQDSEYEWNGQYSIFFYDLGTDNVMDGSKYCYRTQDYAVGGNSLFFETKGLAEQSIVFDPASVTCTGGINLSLDPTHYYAFGIQMYSLPYSNTTLMLAGSPTEVPDTMLYLSTVGGFQRPPGVQTAFMQIDGIDVYENTPDPVVIVPGLLGSMEKNGIWIIDPLLHVYDDLIATLESNGYVASSTLFTLPYDWRESNTKTAILIKSKIDEIKTICNCSKVDVVAHSMGGLATRYYIESTNYSNDIDQVIFLGTPHLGAPKAYLAWEGGTSPLNIVDRVINRILLQQGKHLGYDSLFDYIKNKPILSLKELLPIYSYKTTASIDMFSVVDDIYPLNYPENQFLEFLKTNKSALYNVSYYNIIGSTTQSTVGNISVWPPVPNSIAWEHGQPINLISGSALSLVNGDGTVPVQSSSELSIYKSFESEHTDLPDIASGDVVKILTGKEATTIINNPNTPDARLLFIELFSPVDMIIVAPDGKRIGKDFDTDLEVNEIPGAFYSGFYTDNEFIAIPNPVNGEYKVSAKGTGNGGDYIIAVSNISTDRVEDVSFTGNILPNKEEQMSINVDSSASTTLNIALIDLTPPTILITNPLSQDYERSKLIIVSATSTDDTGIATSTIKFADRFISNNQSIDLFFEKLGTTTINAVATDFQDNIGSTSLDFRIIATASSTISDIERLFTLGWITKKGIKDELIQKLNKVIKLQKRIIEVEEKVGNKKTKKKIEVIEKIIDKTLGRALLVDLRGYTRDKINTQAYNLIKEDLEWIINNHNSN